MPEQTIGRAIDVDGGPTEEPRSSRTEQRRLARALSAVKRRINNPKLPNDACYAGVAYGLPDPPMVAAAMLLASLGPIPPGKSIDRIEPAGDYALGNLRYATPKEQTANRRPQKKSAADTEDDWEGE